MRHQEAVWQEEIPEVFPTAVGGFPKVAVRANQGVRTGGLPVQTRTKSSLNLMNAWRAGKDRPDSRQIDIGKFAGPEPGITG
jgi:hypothetical protein